MEHDARACNTGGYARRVMLMYDGIHYDALYCQAQGTATVATVFAIDDVEVRLSLFPRVSRPRGTALDCASLGSLCIARR